VLPAPILPTAAEDLEQIRSDAGYDSDDEFFDTKEQLLQQAVRGIQKTDQGLKSLIEKTPSTTEAIKPTSATAAVTKPTLTSTEAAIEQPIPILSDSDFHTFNVNLKVPRLRKRHGNTWKLTWFGFILATFVAWFFAESAVCEIHCRPTMSRKHNWRPGQPSFGFALPYKLDYWTGEVVSRSWNSIDHALGPRRKGPQNIGRDWFDGRSKPVGIVRNKSSYVSSFSSDEIVQ